MDTIFALATAPGKSGVAIIRVSGPSAWIAARKLTKGPLPKPQCASVRQLIGPDDELLDEALVITFADGHSFTGEGVVEFHIHGSTAIIKSVLGVLANLNGLRPAEAGEFTKRALENERLDLTQVEGLADLIDSETEAQRRQAMKVLSGVLGERVKSWRCVLIRAAALLEATIDFVDEDVPIDVRPEVILLLDQIICDLTQEATGVIVAERIRDGFEVAIVGPPNAGKSTLLNALAGRDAAITSEIAGTTRDVIEVRMDLNGLPVTLLDTAGLHEANNTIEIIGINRAIDRAKAADLRVFLSDGISQIIGLDPVTDDIVIRGKIDQASGPGVSGKTGQGLSELVDQISAILTKRSANVATATRERHRLAIERSLGALNLAVVKVERGSEQAELAAEEIRHAIRSLDSLVGLVDVEHILDEIFSSFCIGK